MRRHYNVILENKIILQKRPLDWETSSRFKKNIVNHLFFLIEREYFGFNTLESVVGKNRKLCLGGKKILSAIHEKNKFKYLKNLTLKVCKIWCNDVYMSILQCDIFWWKLIDRIVLSRKVITHPSFASFFLCEIKKNN
jgi:hypothetical protein